MYTYLFISIHISVCVDVNVVWLTRKQVNSSAPGSPLINLPLLHQTGDSVSSQC